MVNLLEISGNSELTHVTSEGMEEFTLSLTVTNPTSNVTNIETAYFFFASEGGWSWFIDDLIAKDGNFFSINPHVGPSSTQIAGPFGYLWSEPASYVIIQVHVSNAIGQEQHVLSVIPIKRLGFTSPKDLNIKAPVFIGVQEPVEVIPMHRDYFFPSNMKFQSTQKKILIISGQLVNGTGKKLLLKSFKAILESGKLVKTTVFNNDLPFAFFDSSDPKDPNKPVQLNSVTSSSLPIISFLYLFELPDNFSEGTLTIKATTAFTNNNQKLNFKELSYSTVVKLAPISKMQAPVGKAKGSWKWGNGPGVAYFTTHSRPEGRYSYDLVIVKKDSINIAHPFRPDVTRYWHSDPSKNDSFFCFDRPIMCMHEGEVIEVIDNIPDNNGLTVDPSGPSSVIVVQHGTANRKVNRYSKYCHIRQNSAMVKKGDFVTTGQILAKIGNAGASSEPHLHLGYFMIDLTGRLRALPMTFKNLHVHPIADNPFWSEKVMGVPTGDRKYFVS